MSDLPKGWSKVPISKIGEIITGNTPPTKEREIFYGGKIPFVKPPDLEAGDLLVSANETLSDIGVTQGRLLPPYSTLVGCIGNIGKVAFSQVACCTNQQINSIVPNQSIAELKYVYWYVLSPNFQKLLQANSSATTVAIINKGRFSNLEILLPPIAEQKRIVTKLDSLFAHTRRARQELDHIPKLIERYKQAILSAAFYGKLNVFSDITNKKPITKNIRSLITKLDQGWSPKCLSSSSNNEHEWGVIKTTAIQDIYFNPNENKALPSHLEPRTNLEIVKGDVLITRAGPRSRVGICCYVDKTRKNLILCDKVYRLKVNLELIDPLYLTMILNSPPVKKLIEKMKSGISDSGLNLTQEKFLNLCIPYYSIAEQVSIIAEISKAFLQIDKIAIEAAKSAAFLDRLEQSTLAKAFRGEIVPQDPNDEPANILLERIQKERENQQTPKKRQLSLF